MTRVTRAATRTGALATIALCWAGQAQAVSLLATSSNFRSVFERATGGDTIILSGNFGAMRLADRSFATPLRIDASRASFSGTLAIHRMSGLSFTGGRFGDGTGTWQAAGTIRVTNSSNIDFTRPILRAGAGRARGLTFTATDNFSVSGGSFSGFRLALASTGGNDGTFTGNRIVRATSDGINIVDSHRITARGNSCSGSNPSPGSHADCIQLWSLAGNPVQSDIQLLYNYATGNTQGFTSFDPSRGGGLRISMIGNRVDTSMPQGIACYGCVDSIITDNVLTTLPGSRYRTSLNVVGGRNNIVANNSIGPRTVPPRSTVPRDGRDSFGLELASLAGAEFGAFDSGFGTGFDDDFADPSALAGIPEPSAWLQLIAGFALIGSFARRRRSGQLRLQEAG